MTTPPQTQDALNIINEITELGYGFKTGSQGAREGLLSAASRLIASLQHPTETALELLWAQPTHLNVIRMAVEIKLFDALLSTPSSGERSAVIASRCTPDTVDPVLVARMLRHLASMSTVRETGPDTFAPSATSKAFASQNYQDTILYIVDNFQPALDACPSFFRANGFQAPTSSVDAPFQHAFEKGVHYFEYFDRFDQEMGKRFASMMDVWSMGRQRWFDLDYYPVEERLISGASRSDNGEEAVLLVDVGGGTGHDVNGLREAFGDRLPGKLVLQDRPEIIEHAVLNGEADVKMAHDFLTEQPVKAARAYYLHSIIQDWSDEINTTILRSIVAAMKRGYSKVLINDFVVPNQGAHWSQTSLDWELMASLGARHRTVAEHSELYEGAGLRITGVWRHPHSLDSLIELELLE
ncbi:hypothetical protein SLS61_000171 [Didymella pomorum]